MCEQRSDGGMQEERGRGLNNLFCFLNCFPENKTPHSTPPATRSSLLAGAADFQFLLSIIIPRRE